MRRLTRAVARISFHPNRNIRTLITAIYTIAALIVNFYMLQVMCMPVWWAGVFIGLLLIAIHLYPYLNNIILRSITAFLLGVGIFISIYSILFLADPWANFLGYIAYIIGILAMGLGLLPFLFVYYLYHIYRYYKEGIIIIKRTMIAGLLVPVVATSIYLVPFKRELQQFEQACSIPDTVPRYVINNKDMQYPELIEPNIYTEQFIGIGMKYHTKLEFTVDGWRPPMHDPLLNIGLWLYSDTYYPVPKLNRIKYYKLFFPERSYKFNCPCSYMHDGMTYFDTEYWPWPG